MSSLSSRVDGYSEVGKRSALICVVMGLVLSACLALISFASPFYKTTPYDGYDITYYFDEATYSPDIIDDIPYSKCNNDSYNQNCNKLTEISSIIIGFIIGTVLMITILCIFMLKQIISKKKLITKRHLLYYLFGILICWILITAAIHSFMKSFPNTKYCAYNGNNTGCKWYTAIHILLSVTSIFTVLASVIIGLIAPFCKIFKFLPFFGTNNYDDDEFDGIKQQHISSMDDDDMTINEEKDDKNTTLITNNYNPENRKKHCAYLTIPELCSILILSVGLVLLNIILILSYFNEWYPSDYNSQIYVNNKWNDAECVDLNGSSIDPIIYKENNDAECSFSYPDSDGNYNSTFWSCCQQSTCHNAFDYTLLINGYNTTNTDSASYKCWIDMKAIKKASCHPNGQYFVDENFNISTKPSQKQSKLAVCALFCKQTYDHCSDMIWAEMTNSTVKELWSKYDDFCENALGVKVRYEAFTDRCFAGCNQYKLYVIIFTVISMMIINE